MLPGLLSFRIGGRTRVHSPGSLELVVSTGGQRTGDQNGSQYRHHANGGHENASFFMCCSQVRTVH